MKKIVLFFVVWCFLLSACSYNTELETELSELQSDIIFEETVDEKEASSQEEVQMVFGQVQGNILGYSLIRNTDGITYIRDADYLIEENAIGSGIFVSEHIAETEVFLGQILMDVLANRGEISEEKKRYFTDWAVQQLDETKWQLLDKEWQPNKYAYDRFYTTSNLWGNIGYEFTYTIYADDTSFTKSETQVVQVRCAVDCNGIISGICVDIAVIDMEYSGVLNTENSIGLFRDEHQEPVLEMGIKAAYNDTALAAQYLGDFALAVLEKQYADVAEYKDLFVSETAFWTFLDYPWEQLGTDWSANRFYDCYRTDEGFLYYIYPDYEKMDAETAKAVTLRFFMDTKSKKLTNTEIFVVSMKREQYIIAKEYLGGRSLAVENGEIRGYGNAQIPIPSKALAPIPIKEYTFDNTTSKLMEKKYGSGIFVDENMQPYLFGKSLWKELAEHSETFGMEDAGEGWQILEGYDSYYYPHNQRAGSNHYRYYFTFYGQEEGQEKILRVDTWVSQNEIVEVEHGWFTTGILQEEADMTFAGESVVEMDITAFLAFDWTADSVLWEHSLQPNDSAQGWEFSVADIDFDGTLEMLVTFSANHCGQNCLYIYKQDKGGVYSLADTIACFEKYVVFGTDYKKLSPYLDIELLDVYVDEKGVCKYLSLDSSSFGGDSKGGIYTLHLYETILEKNAVPKELVRIEEVWPEERREIYFLGERVYELGALREFLAAYMDGYTKQEIRYKTAEKVFPRDIVFWGNEEKRQELELLYDALREAVQE